MNKSRRLYYLFPGHGSERVNMARELYDHYPLYSEYLDHCIAKANSCLSFDLKQVLYPEPELISWAAGHIHQTEVSQPLLFAVEYSLAKILEEIGLRPNGMMGHSVSEYVAACLAGVFSLETAMKIVVKRGQLVQGRPPGSMLAIALSEEEVQPWLSDRISLGSTLGKNQTVVSGYPEAISELQMLLDERQIMNKEVLVTRAFHSVMLDPILDEFGKFLAKQEFNTPQLDFISGVTGTWADPKAVQTTHYWVKQLRDPVRFHEGITTLKGNSSASYLEVGAGNMLSKLINRIDSSASCYSICGPHNQEIPEKDHFLRTIRILRDQYNIAGLHKLDLHESDLTEIHPKANEPQTIKQLDPVESEVHQVFCKVLGLPQIGSGENFMEAGGNSLMGMQVVSRLRDHYSIELPFKVFFDNPTIMGLSQYIRSNPDRRAQPRVISSRVKPRSAKHVQATSTSTKPPSNSEDLLKFSLFFFSGDQDSNPQDRYRMVMEGAKFADQYNFEAIWIPERHFNKFGGLYPNPSVLAAAISATTNRVHVRGGSVVAPLHHPVRIAEEWSVVDNISQGRCGISYGSGFHPKDFILNPEGFDDRRNIMFETIDQVRKLWGGEWYQGKAGGGETMKVQIFPKPFSHELPLWLSTTRSKETFTDAGKLGVNVLTALLRLSIDELEERITIYRNSLEEHGHDPESGVVTLMLHTFIESDFDQVKNHAFAPLKEYLGSHLEHTMAVSEEKTGGQSFTINDDEIEELIRHAFDRYARHNSLLGTVDSCTPILKKLQRIGVNEIACLIDFGVDLEPMLSSLLHINKLKETINNPG